MAEYHTGVVGAPCDAPEIHTKEGNAGRLVDALELDKMDALVRSLRTCSSPRDCEECPYRKEFGESGCDRLEADAAEAIQKLLDIIANLFHMKLSQR